mmetsp:Transcript_153839/g.493344  ORF Transcript_153839/g.493344 Transcript_153839/m.493344 type:complete len:274 (+) Transcript_153839:2137-2958(+)
MRLEEPLLVVQARQPHHAADVGHGDRTIFVNAGPIVQHGTRVVDHRGPLQVLAQSQHRLRQEGRQHDLRIVDAAGAPLQLSLAALIRRDHPGAEGQRSAPPIGDHGVPHDAEGSLDLVVGEPLKGVGLTGPQHAGLQLRIAVQLLAELACEAQGWQKLAELREGLEDGAKQGLDANGVASGQEAERLNLPERIYLVGVRRLAPARELGPSQRRRALESATALMRPRRHRVELADVQAPQLAHRKRRVANRLERLCGITPCEGEQEQLPSGMLL